MSCKVTTLSNEDLLLISGPEALKFLQGQTSCDTRLIDEQRGAEGLYCTPQGRVISDFLLCQLEAQQFALRMRSDVVAETAAIFGKYIVFSKATLADNGQRWQLLGLWGESAADTLSKLLGKRPSDKLHCATAPGLVVVQRDTSGQRFECYADRERAGEFLEQLHGACDQGVEAQWQALDLVAGVARINKASSQMHIPQALNYDLTGHISFNKGCYTGQEVVARLHYRGSSKRRLYLLAMDDSSEAGFSDGEVIYSVGTDQPAGTIINASENLALVSTTAKSLAGGLSVHTSQQEAQTLSVLPLPYKLPGDATEADTGSAEPAET